MNNMSTDQVSTVLRAVLSQATGQTDLAALSLNQLLSIGQKTLVTAKDPLITSISQVLSRTIFSRRPYRAKFRGMYEDSAQWGNWVRKIVTVEKESDLQDDPYLPLTDGQSVDPWVVNKPAALQLNFYDEKVYMLSKSFMEHQLDTAFNSAEEFSQFNAMILGYMADKIEKTHEETARATLAGFMAGKIAGDAPNVVHLVTEYNAEKGTSLTSTTAFAPGNFEDFARWVFSKIDIISNSMTEWSVKYHQNLADGVIMRHTPMEYQRLYLYYPYFAQVQTNVLTSFIEKWNKVKADVEMVNYWQAIDTPDSINVIKPNTLNSAGSVVQSSNNLSQNNILGVICDREAFGYTSIFREATTTPVNARGLYRTMYWHFAERNNIDFTENGVVLLLD